MARSVVQAGRASIKTTCLAFGISQTCYRYDAKLNAENEVIADWFVRLTNHLRNRGFGLCFLYLRNVKGFRWHHKRVYRMYRKLALNMRQTASPNRSRQAWAIGSTDEHQLNLVNEFYARSAC